MNMKTLLNFVLQAILEALDNFAIVVASLAIYLMMAFGYDQSAMVIERNPGALMAVLVFVAVWTLTIVFMGAFVRVLKKLKASEDRPQVQQ